MRLFKVTSQFVSYDEDESMVIVAGNANRALELAREEWSFRDGKDTQRIKFEVEEIVMDVEKVISVARFGN